MVMYNGHHVVFTRVNTTSILQPKDQGVILNLMSYYLRNMFHKAIAYRESIPLMDLGKVS